MLFSRMCYVAAVREMVLIAMLYGKSNVGAGVVNRNLLSRNIKISTNIPTEDDVQHPKIMKIAKIYINLAVFVCGVFTDFAALFLDFNVHNLHSPGADPRIKVREA